MNLKIVINGQEANLPEEMKHELVLRNPLFDYSEIVGNYSTPFSLPFSKRNNAIFANAHRLDVPYTGQDVFRCEKYFNTDLIEDGYVRLKEANKDYSLYFTSNLAEIFADKKTKDLSEYLANITVASREAQVAGTPSVIFPTIQNSGFYQANAPGGWANVVNNHNGTIYTGPTYVAAIQVKYILDRIAFACGFTLAGTFMSNADMDKLYFMQNVEAPSLTVSVANACQGFTGPAFIMELRKALGLVITPNVFAKKMTIDFSKEYFEAPIAADWSNICSPATTGRNETGLSGIKLAYNVNTEDKEAEAWAGLDVYQTPTTAADAKWNEIISQFTPLPTSGGLPIMNEQGRTSTNKQDAKKLSGRLLFYKGLQSTTFGNRPQADYQFGAFSLTNAGRQATLFTREESFWKNTFRTSFDLRLSASKFSSFDIKSKVHIQNFNYYIEEIVAAVNNPNQTLLKVFRA